MIGNIHSALALQGTEVAGIAEISCFLVGGGGVILSYTLLVAPCLSPAQPANGVVEVGEHQW